MIKLAENMFLSIALYIKSVEHLISIIEKQTCAFLCAHVRQSHQSVVRLCVLFSVGSDQTKDCEFSNIKEYGERLAVLGSGSDMSISGVLLK